MTIAEANRRLKAFDIRNRIIKILQADERFLKQLNQDQLYKGKRSDGQNIRPVYASDSYARHKNAITPSPERGLYTPNLYLTSKFYNSIYVRVDNNSIEIGSNDEIGIKLEEKYTSLIFGLNEESKQFYIENYLLPQLIEEFKYEVIG